jgi:arginine kinase
MISSTRIRCGRNLAEFPLSLRMTREERNAIERKISGALTSLDGELEGTYYSLGSLTDDQLNQLVTDHFLFKPNDKFRQSVGINRDWPEGRGIFHNNDKTFLSWVNESDQLRLISMQQDSDIEGVFKRLCLAASKIAQVAQFARNDHLGFITCCPSNLGTGLRASVHIRLPKLGERMVEF